LHIRIVAARPLFELARVKPKSVSIRHRSAWWLNLTANGFNQMDQYVSRPGRRGYHYAEFAIFLPSSGRNHHQYRFGLSGWLHS